MYNRLQCIHMYCIFVGKNHPNGLGSVVGTIHSARDNAAQYAVDALPSVPQSVRGWTILCDIDIQSGTPLVKTWLINPMNAVVVHITFIIM